MFYYFYCVVPTPTIHVIALNTQIVGQSLTLECSVTTVRGITSRVDIVWSSDGEEFRKSVGHLISSTTNNSVIYIDTYTITQLNTTNEGQQIECTVVINGLSTVVTSNTVTLDVFGKIYMLYVNSLYETVCISQSLKHPCTYQSQQKDLLVD